MLACSLVLEVFEEDGETVAWEVGTDPTHPRPYLAVPSNYAPQELDIIAGAATIGQVEVLVIDKSQTPGDQDSGWMTERIANEELRDRRCRLRRFVNETVGYVTIADGPAAVVRMHSSYSGYQWVIRDTRETERNVVAFSNPSNWALLPPGLNEDVGWGELPDGSFLVPPIAGPVSADVAHGATAMDDGSTAIAFINIDPADIVMTQPMLDGAIFEPNGSYRVPADGRGVAGVFPDAIVRWRYAGEGAEDWREIVAPAWSGGNLDGLLPDGPGLILSASGGDVPADVGETVTRVRIGIRPGEEVPTDAAAVELLVLYGGPVSERFPYSIDGKTTGALLKEVYDGVHSPTDGGAVVPTGIRYVDAGLAAMVDPVTLRLTEEVDDARSWTEQKLYAPTGWAPTLDLDLAIYPSSQVVPDSFTGLPEISLANAEPKPDWDAGEFLVNVLEFTYPRYFIVEDDAEVESIDRLAMREVTITFRSGSSIGRKEEKASFDGSAFAAVGGPGGTSLGADEYGASLAADRRLYVFDRYNKGAQAIALPVRRADSALWRNGQWVVVDASWLPDYITKRRGALWGGQIMSIGDLNCAWRIVLVEEAVPLERPPES